MKTTKIHLVTLLTILSLSSLSAYAEDAKTVTSQLKDVTVFFTGAELTHTANGNLLKGENEIRVEGLSPTIDVNSLKIKATNSVVISSYEFSIDYLSSGKSVAPLLKNLQDSIKIYQAKLDKVEIDLKINTNLINHLQNGINKNISGSEKGLGIDELMKTMDYYKSKSELLETTQTSLNKQKTEFRMSIARLQAQLNQESTKGNKTAGVLKLNVSAPRAGSSSFTITYYTSAASWVPFYDINIASIDKPIMIYQKSKVRQTTGLDWEKVKLTLSTATPSNGKVAPLFSTWFLEQRQPLPRPFASNSERMMQNSYSYMEQPMELQEVVVAAPAAKLTGSVSNVQIAAPLIMIDGQPATQEELSSIDPYLIKETKVLKDAAATSVYGSRASAGVIEVTLKNMDDYVTSSDNALNMVYKIDLPYTIPGNGKEQNIDLLTKETSAEYKYYCAPKLDTETYLLAEISDWQKLDLLSGRANVTYDGTYIGETYIDASSTQSTLALTLGTDKRVAVKREKMKDFSTTKFMGSDVQQVFTYKLTVKNNQNKPVKMVLKDQYPISTQKKIEVQLQKDTTPWTVNKEDLGVITWEEEFKAGETKTYQISYSVKYPKDMKLNL